MKKNLIIMSLIIFAITLISCTSNANNLNKRNALKLPEKYTFTMAVNNNDVIILHEKIFNFERFNDFLININENQTSIIRITEFLRDGGILVRLFNYKDDVLEYTVDATRAIDKKDELLYEYGDNISVSVEERVNYVGKTEDFYIYNITENDENIKEVMAFPTFQKYKFVKPSNKTSNE